MKAGKFDALLLALVTVGLLFAHATNNLVNDLTDHGRASTSDNYFRTQYGPQPLESGLHDCAARCSATSPSPASPRSRSARCS